MKFQSRKPNYMSGFDEPPTYFTTKEELLKDPQLVRFAASKRFVRFGVSYTVSAHGPWKCGIMADMDDGTYWCTGYCDSELPDDWFPLWSSSIDPDTEIVDSELVSYREALREKEERRQEARKMTANEISMILDQIGCPKEILEVVTYRLQFWDDKEN